MFDRFLPQHPTIYKWDRMSIGVILGLIVPLSGILVVYLLSVVNHFAHFSFLASTEIMSIRGMIGDITSLQVLIKYLSVGCILNLGVFFLFINRDYFNVARGIIFATILISLPVMAMTIRDWFI